MIHATRQMVRRWLDTLLHVNDTPERTAGAFALGVFLGFSPFLGLHTIVGIALAFILSLNRVAVLLGVYSNLPWIMAPYYAFTTMAGAAILRTNPRPDFQERLAETFQLSIRTSEFWHQVAHLLRPLLWSYTLGSTLGAALLAAIAYRVALEFVVRRRRHHAAHLKPPRTA